MNWSTSVLTTVSSDTEPSIIVTFDKAKYVFNAGENSGRAFLQSKRNWRKTRGIFFTDVGSQRTGGLPGLLMTFADATINRINVFGPPGLLHLMAAMRLYTYRDTMTVEPIEVPLITQMTAKPTPTFKDDNITVYSIPVFPTSDVPMPENTGPIFETITPKTLKRKRQSEGLEATQSPESLEGEAADDWRRLLVQTMFPEPEKPAKKQRSSQEKSEETSGYKDEYRRRRRAPQGFYKQQPKFISPHPRRDSDPSLTPTLSYIVAGPRVRGKFDAEKAEMLKIPSGPLRSRLTKGQTITFNVKEGDAMVERTVKPEEIIGPSEVPQVVIILEVPSASHIPSLVASFADSPFYAKFRSHRPEDMADYKIRTVFHICGEGVLEDERYTAFMNGFDPQCHHVIASREHCPDPVTFTSAAFQQLRLQSLDPEIFSVPKFSLQPAKDIKAIPNMPERCHLMTSSSTIHLRPPTELIQEDTVQDLDFFHPAVSSPTPIALPSITKDKYAEAQAAVKAVESDANRSLCKGADIGVYPLGTGSAVPSKYRNVSSTLITIPGFGNILLDTGEGTWGQLVRLFGTDKAASNNVWEVLRNIRCIFASHIHGDHHMGLSTILRKRLMLDPRPTSPLYLVTIRSVHLSLREVSEVQNLGFDDPSGNGVITVMSEALHWKDPPTYPDSGRWMLGGREPWTDIDEYEMQSKRHAKDLCAALNLKSFRTVDVRHRTTCYGLDIKSLDGWSIVFSADTTPADSLVYAGQGATLLIHEATMADDQEELASAKAHSTHSQAVGIGKRMRAENILLTHFSARYPKLPSSGTKQQEGVVVHAFDHASLTIGNMWKLKHYLPAVVQSLKDTEDEDDQEADDAIAHAGMDVSL
ncbi:beta-lactamase-like protein [Desarmillaria ectypa]|nr:beta-lactamase-like protein [Desarmillaria ectypa]